MAKYKYLCNAADAANRCSWLKAPRLLFAPWFDEDELADAEALEELGLEEDALSPSFCPEPANLNLASVFFFLKNSLMADMMILALQ